jgi:hypothetical protein
VPFLLRAIRKAKWYRENPDLQWFIQDELQADALYDLKTENNTLSVWHIVDDHSNKEQIVTALAATRQYATQFDYFLIQEYFIHEINIKISEVVGDSPDRMINSWHRDLIELSAEKLMRLAKTIQLNAEIGRIPSPDIRRSLAQAMLAARLDSTKMHLTAEALAGIIKLIGDQGLHT